MPQVKRNFSCFRCHYFNKVKVPHYFKGKKCKKCNSFNYFNYIPKYKREKFKRKNFEHPYPIFFPLESQNRYNDNKISFNTNFNYDDDNNSVNSFESFENRNRNNISNTNNNFANNFIYNDINRIMTINNNNNNINNNNNFFYENNLNNILSNRISNNIDGINNNINNNNSIINYNYLSNYDEDIFFDIINNRNRNNSDNNYNNNNNDNNFFSFDYLKREEENIIIPWLKKEKATEEIKKKYKDERCPICLVEINGNISITKCHHIFHYNCIAKNIQNYGNTECPICRCDLKTGKKKEIADRNRLNTEAFNELFNFNNLRAQNVRQNQRNNNEYNINNNRNNNLNSNDKLIKNLENIILIIGLIIGYLWIGYYLSGFNNFYDFLCYVIDKSLL